MIKKEHTSLCSLPTFCEGVPFKKLLFFITKIIKKINLIGYIQNYNGDINQTLLKL